MTSASGLGPYSRTELVNKLAGEQVSFSFFTSYFSRGFQGSSTTSDLKTLFEMIYLFFTMPRLDNRAIEAILDQYRTMLIHQSQDPQIAFSRELRRTIYNYHPLFMPLELDDLEKVSIEHANEFLNRCLNPADYTFVFSGNINLNEIYEYLETYLASIPDSYSMTQWIDPVITRPNDLEKTIYQGIEERCFVYLAWYAPGVSNFDEKKNQVSSVLTEYLRILLSDEIREKLSGVYSISAGTSVSVIQTGEYSLNVYFQCNPARADELIAAVQDRINDIINLLLNIDILNKSKEALLMQHENQMQRNLHIAQSYANSSVLYNTPLSRLNQRPEIIRSVTAEDVQTLCRDILVNGPVKVIMYPEGWE
jgi:zinc protease